MYADPIIGIFLAVVIGILILGSIDNYAWWGIPIVSFCVVCISIVLFGRKKNWWR